MALFALLPRTSQRKLSRDTTKSLHLTEAFTAAPGTSAPRSVGPPHTWMAPAMHLWSFARQLQIMWASVQGEAQRPLLVQTPNVMVVQSPRPEDFVMNSWRGDGACNVGRGRDGSLLTITVSTQRFCSAAERAPVMPNALRCELRSPDGYRVLQPPQAYAMRATLAN